MKKLNYFIALVLFFLLFSCENDSIVPTEPEYLNSQDAFIVGLNFLKLEKGVYSLTMTETDLIKYNISPLDYNRMLSDVSKTNEEISKIENKTEIAYFDPEVKKVDISEQIPTRLGGLYPLPEVLGQISTNGSHWGYATFFIPTNTFTVSVLCVSSGFLQLFNVSIGSKLKSGVAYVTGTWHTDIVPETTNVSHNCSFKTSNSNGGFAKFVVNFNPDPL